jgi:hypothetical protein
MDKIVISMQLFSAILEIINKIYKIIQKAIKITRTTTTLLLNKNDKKMINIL